MDFIRKAFGGDDEKHSHTHAGEVCHDLHAEHRENRYQSFAPQTSGHVKWHVDGCSYFWALSEALEGEKLVPPLPTIQSLRDTAHEEVGWTSPLAYEREPC